MNSSSIRSLDEIYSCNENYSITYDHISFPELKELDLATRRLRKQLGEISTDEYWNSIIRRLKRLIFLFSAAPLDKEYLGQFLSENIIRLDNSLNRCKQFYPQYLPYLENIIAAANTLSKSELQILHERLSNTLREILPGSTAILIKETSVIPTVEKQINPDNDTQIEIVSYSSLRRDLMYENLIVVGPASPYWYPDYVFSAPRAKNIFVLKYTWLRGKWEPKNYFPATLKKTARKFIEMNIFEEDATTEEVDFLLPEINFDDIAKKIELEIQSNPSSQEEELVTAKIIQLENGQIVFIDYDDNSTELVIDPEDEKNPITRIKAKDLEPYMFLLLRTSGGGDYIIPLANHILGEKAAEAREIQIEWKDLLRRLVITKGSYWVINNLMELGSKRANPMNLHNWMSYRSIRTQDFSDFSAIMTLIGLKDNERYVWNMMEAIRHAHMRAGNEIRKLLIEVAKKADLSELVQKGVLEFELPDRDAGSLTAYRITEISKQTIQVPPSKMNIPLESADYGKNDSSKYLFGHSLPW